MANINKQIEKIRSSIYGKDVRESIASGLESMNSQCEQTESFSNDKVEEMNHLKQTLEEAEQTRIMNESERSIHENERISEEAERNLRFQALDRETQFQHNQIISQQAFLENAIAEWNDQKDRGEFHGSFWLYGNGVPNDDIGKMNDWYIDRSSKYWCIYHRDHSGWTDTGRNLIGNVPWVAIPFPLGRSFPALQIPFLMAGCYVMALPSCGEIILSYLMLLESLMVLAMV